MLGEELTRGVSPLMELGVHQQIEGKLSIDLGVDKHSIRPLGGRRFSQSSIQKGKRILRYALLASANKLALPPKGFLAVQNP
jgi:hypothetical protein